MDDLDELAEFLLAENEDWPQPADPFTNLPSAEVATRTSSSAMERSICTARCRSPPVPARIRPSCSCMAQVPPGPTT